MRWAERPSFGISKPVIKAHGSSDALAICNAIRQARDFTQSGLIDQIQQDVELMRVEKNITSPIFY